MDLFSSLAYMHSVDDLLQCPGFKYHLVADNFQIYITSLSVFLNSHSYCP